MPKKIKTLNDVPAISDYLKRIGAEPRSLRTAVVKEMHGSYWKDIATVSFDRDGNIRASSPEIEPTEEEKKAIVEQCGKYAWPQLKLMKRPVYPKAIKEADPQNIFEFRSMKGELIMVQVRIEVADGEKRYVPWTLWDDNEWRAMEPDGPLPLWGLDQLAQHSVVFIHEGAKAAKACYDMINGTTPADKERLAAHPWGEELAHAAHVGWIGGALSPLRTDWTAIKKAGVHRAFIVSDNDSKGLQAVPNIARQLRIQTFQVQFTSEWPPAFDLADPFPEKFFKTMDGSRYYAGPSFRACLHPATWATDVVPNKHGKPTTVLRDNFKDMWAYIEEADLYVCTEMPEILRTETIANKMLAAFSHSNQTTQLITKAYTGRSARICYRPDIKGRMVTNRGTSAINLHTPTQVKSKAGNPECFLNFMNYMIPSTEERREVLRWIATLVAQPTVRMEYGLLLVSEHQGIGKTTLGQAILAPLVGYQNVSYPAESDIVNSDFNGWLAQKRLVVVNEIYSGHSWKAYNKLKTFITDMEVQVNEKFQRTYTIDNWCHIFACSNSSRALRIEDDDRRWFIPTVTEARWPEEKFVELYGWINSGGLSIIKHWAENFGDYIKKGQRAPMSDQKRIFIDDSRSDAQKEVADLARELSEFSAPAGLTMSAVKAWLKQANDRIYDSDYELRKVMQDNGCPTLRQQIKISGRLQYIVMNTKLLELMNGKSDAREKAEIIRDHLKSPNDILGVLM